MSGEIAAVADIATGAVLAGAVEPDAGDARGISHGSCLNCKTELQGAHCHACGQKGNVHRTLRAFGHDILHSVLHFDGKIWRTLPLLFWKPGELTRRYIHGERANFVSPIALFLFMVFFSFATFSWLSPATYDVAPAKPATEAEAKIAYEQSRKEVLEGIKELEDDKAKAIADQDPVGSYAWIDSQLIQQRAALAALEAEGAKGFNRGLAVDRKVSMEKSKLDAEIERLEARIAEEKKLGKPTKDLEDQLTGVKLGSDMAGNVKSVMGVGKGEDGKVEINILGNRTLEEAAEHAIENPQLLAYKIQSNAYKYSWALIPISLPFMWLIFFWRRQFKMFDHAVFITYSLCFMMALGSIGALVIALSAEDSAPFVIAILVLTFVPPIHIYKQLRGAYQTGRFSALWRTFVLSNFALIALTLFGILILTLGITG
jgi:Protein of unknown function (DUF3667)